MSIRTGRKYNALREVEFIPNFCANAHGSCLVRFGKTQVLCTANLDITVPQFIKNTGKGWLTAEYGMLPSATNERIKREAIQGKQSGRTMEIQRLIGRSLRQALDFTKLGERQIIIDCDVLVADGGTRTASINGSYIALVLAIRNLQKKKILNSEPIVSEVAAVSVGICNNQTLVDLDYLEDSNAEVDANFVMNDKKELIEIQSAGEARSFTQSEFSNMMKLAENAIDEILQLQRNVLRGNS